jgi:hypothetical protein
VSHDIEKKDILFIGVFSLFIFFGAFFLFASLKKTQTRKQISVRNLEKNINYKVNKKIQKLQTRSRMFKSKIEDFKNVNKADLGESIENRGGVKYKIDIFKPKDSNLAGQVPLTASERVEALLNSEDNSVEDKRDLLEQYKEEMIEKAREQGWAIELSDELEVISARKL